MTAPAAPMAVDVAALVMELQDELYHGGRHAERCQRLGCQACIDHDAAFVAAFDALTAVAGEQYALDVVAGAD